MTTAAAAAAPLLPSSPAAQEVDEQMMMEDIATDMKMTMNNVSPTTTTSDDDDNDADADADIDMMQAFEDEGCNGEDCGGDPLLDDDAAITEDIANYNTTRQVSDSTNGTTAPQRVELSTLNLMTGTPNTLLISPSPTPPPPLSAAAASAASSHKTHTEDPLQITGRPSIPLYLSCNPDHLSEYQCLIRKHVELFEATAIDTQAKIKGRNKPIVLGQVGIRCVHCHYVAIPDRDRGSMYYPHALVGIYQAAQILSQQHLLETCGKVPVTVRQDLTRLKTTKSGKTAGKEYWAATANALGVYEDQYGLRFETRLGLVRGHVAPH
jgi:hypothetical protein